MGLDIPRFLADDGMPFGQCGRDFSPGPETPLVRPPVGCEECARAQENHDADSDRSGQHSRHWRHRAHAQAYRCRHSADQVQTSWNGREFLLDGP